MNLFELLPKIAATNSINEKKAIASRLDEESRRLVYQALNPMLVHNVKKIKMPDTFSEQSDHAKNFIALLALLIRMDSRQVSGNALQESVTRHLSLWTKSEAEIIKRVILKDLKCGAGIAIFNSVFPEDEAIPTFDVPLAMKYNGTSHLVFPLFADVKYDGIRTIARVSEDTIHFYSRAGKLQTHLEGVFDEELYSLREKLIRYLNLIPSSTIMIDGEVMGDSFKETMKAKGKGSSKEHLTFFVFDSVTELEFSGDNSAKKFNQTQRYMALKSALSGGDRVRMVDTELVMNRDQMVTRYEKVISEGHEGLILKNNSGYYVRKRNTHWLKYKPVHTFDGVITGIEEGKGEFEGLIGALRVEGTDENGAKFKCRVGSGFTHAFRKTLTEQHADGSLVGQMVEVAAQEMTDPDEQGVHSLRFPIFSRFRGDK